MTSTRRLERTVFVLGLPPLAIVRIPGVKIEVPVVDGRDELVLNRGATCIAETTLPGPPANVGITGHRDSFFRALEDITVGDSLTLITAHDTST